MIRRNMGLLAVVAVFAAAVAYCAVQFSAARASGRSMLQTDLLALMPVMEVKPLAEQAVAGMERFTGEKAVFLVEHADAETAKKGARLLAEDLRVSGAYVGVVEEIAVDPALLPAFYLPHRFSLLSRGDRAALSAAQGGLADGAGLLSGLLARRLFAPPGAGLVPLSEDPFGWLERRLVDLPLNRSRLWLENGPPVLRDALGASPLVVAGLPGSAYDAAVQTAAAAAADKAQRHLLEALPGAVLVRTGAVFYAERAHRMAESEIDTVTIAATLGIAVDDALGVPFPQAAGAGFPVDGDRRGDGAGRDHAAVRQDALADGGVRRKPGRRGGRLFHSVLHRLYRRGPGVGAAALCASGQACADGGVGHQPVGLRHFLAHAFPLASTDRLLRSRRNPGRLCLGSLAASRLPENAARAPIGRAGRHVRRRWALAARLRVLEGVPLVPDRGRGFAYRGGTGLACAAR
ncbi:MAG: hypothetical protein MO853_06665 [Candidatus Protistobacter heckmanni]|nr:hypothetical protein [Candidatus Protistobacter heckmanni]